MKNKPAALLAALTAVAGMAIASCERHSWEDARKLQHHEVHEAHGVEDDAASDGAHQDPVPDPAPDAVPAADETAAE